MTGKFEKKTRHVQRILQEMGYSYKVKELAESTRSAEEAAKAVQCKLGQIAKSLIFKGKKSNKPVLVIASGANRVNIKKIRDLVREPIQMADPEFVRETTGYAIGGVAPVGHTTSITTFIDEDLMQYEWIWAAGGTPRSLFRLAPGDLVKMTEGTVVAVK